MSYFPEETMYTSELSELNPLKVHMYKTQSLHSEHGSEAAIHGWNKYLQTQWARMD